MSDDGSGIRKDDLAMVGGGEQGGRYGTYFQSFIVVLISTAFIATSKAYNPSSLDDISTFGFRGEGTSKLRYPLIQPLNLHISYTIALASVADLSLLEISTRTAWAKESSSIVLKVCGIDNSDVCISLIVDSQGWRTLVSRPVCKVET